MSYPITYQKLFQKEGAGPKLREDIMPDTVVKTTSQSLTTAQQKQALSNIGAVSFINTVITKRGGTAV